MNDICCKTESLAMATVPMQAWSQPCDWKTALQIGTIFPCLNLEFFRAEETAPPACCDSKCDCKPTDRETAMEEINAVSFAINDLTLYLDTHPECQEALTLFRELLSKRLELLEDYASKYNPLTQLSIVTGTPDSKEYSWAEGPLPWEGGHI